MFRKKLNFYVNLFFFFFFFPFQVLCWKSILNLCTSLGETLSPSIPSNEGTFINTDRSKAVLLLWFIQIVIFRPLSVRIWHFLHFIQKSLVAICWETAASLCFSLVLVPLYDVFVVCVQFPFGGMLNSIVSIPDHYIFIYFQNILNGVCIGWCLVNLNY